MPVGRLVNCSLSFEVSISAGHSRPSVFPSAVLDIGFDGFALVSQSHNQKLGLEPIGGGATTKIELANRSTQRVTTASGRVRLGDKEVSGVILIQESDGDVLLGLKFISKMGVLLTDGENVSIVVDADARQLKLSHLLP